MANYALAALVNGQTLVNAKYNKPEQRRQAPSVLELALKNQSIAIPDAQDLRVSPLRPVDVNYFSNIAAGTATAKSYNHTGTIGNSGKVSVTYSQIVETFSLPRKLGQNNYIKYEQMWVNQFGMACKNIRTRQDNAALAYLLANKNMLLAATMSTRLASSGLGQFWDDPTLALSLPAGSASLIMAYIKSAMEASLYDGEYDIVADLQMGTIFENYMNQGSGNQSNTTWQFAGCNIAKTQSVVDANFAGGAVLALPAGSFAALTWNEALNVKGDFEDAGGSVGSFTTVDDPFGSGTIFDVSMYTGRADTSSDTAGGSTQDIVDQWEFTSTIGFVLPPLGLALDSVCMEVGLKTGITTS